MVAGLIGHWPLGGCIWPVQSRGWAGRIGAPAQVPAARQELTLDLRAHSGLGLGSDLGESLAPVASVSSCESPWLEDMSAQTQV